MKRILLLVLSFVVLATATFCTTSDRHHDGEYIADAWIQNITLKVEGESAVITSPLTGAARVPCRQYKDRIELGQGDRGQIYYADKDGNLLLGVGNVKFIKQK